MSSARVLMNGCAERAGMKMRGERPGAGEPESLPLLPEIENFFSDMLRIGILIYKRGDIPFSLMMKAVMCPTQSLFTTSTLPRTSEEG